MNRTGTISFSASPTMAREGQRERGRPPDTPVRGILTRWAGGAAPQEDAP